MLASILSLTFTFPMPSKPTFHIDIPSISSIPSSTQENASPVPPTITTFALPGSAAEDLLRRAPAPKPAYNDIKSQLSTWNLNTPNPGVEYDKSITSFASHQENVKLLKFYLIVLNLLNTKLRKKSKK